VHPTRYPARYFSLNPQHRFLHSGCPYPFLYIGIDVATCLFERFGGLMYEERHALPSSLWQPTASAR
jgi:hypothetical protein